jgi:hypothetical protein
METGLAIGAVVIVVVGSALIVMYQRWKQNSRTQADLDARRDEQETSE